jgi:arylsulfatase A-like enzyme
MGDSNGKMVAASLRACNPSSPAVSVELRPAGVRFPTLRSTPLDRARVSVTDSLQRKRPNVLLIITDQQRADHVGFGGNDILRTPNLDAFAARSTVFDRAYVANPICMPNRSTILTGRVPSVHGCVFNDRALPWGANTCVRVLRNAGYRTALIGKSHLQPGLSSEQVFEPDAPAAVDDPYPTGWDAWENPGRYEEGLVDVPEDFYGFDHVEFAIGHGDQVAGHHYRWALERGGVPAALTGIWGIDRPAKQRYADWWQIYQPVVPESLYSTTFVTEQAVSWLEDAAPREEPWFLQCSYPDPHHPFTPPGKWWDAYDPDAMPIPATFNDPLTNAPKHLRLIKGLKPGKNPVQMFGATEDQLRHAFAAEYGMLEMIDQGVGQVLAALERTGAADDTLVIFTSDHGDMFGDHGLMLKGWMHFQGTLRVPLAISAPGSTPGRTRSLASSLDLAQTVLDYCDLEPYEGMQGASLRPLIADPNAEVRDHVYIEDDNPNFERMRVLPEKARTLLTDDGRITRYASGETEIFDLAVDPDEMNDLADQPAGRDRRAHLTERLAAALLRYTDLSKPGPLVL